ncbi:periplasmic divalent cation tolerance protein [Inhella inkyongensis]|uniref:Periplasmic divalent cation tolerance protein n=1 Tax=Inhella inkyongensis TaxID=392593 RepID=A0A840S4G6_9BURK|nr:divalent-cation tolerance protein CutA [Inhella inkyongensis]MBB5205265.1 periplasmic divalent cation tolerance protein [Inhella inkyongensis]
MAPALLLALTTVASSEQAQQLARGLVEQRLAACVQIQVIESVYRWDGALQQDSEWRLLIKTTQARWSALQDWLLAQHPYAVPALLAWPASQAAPAFADWVRGECLP